jgi:hypothetical protein
VFNEGRVTVVFISKVMRLEWRVDYRVFACFDWVWGLVGILDRMNVLHEGFPVMATKMLRTRRGDIAF